MFNFAQNNENLKHADCDGNGVVNFDDTLAIDFNYLNTHNKFEAAPELVVIRFYGLRLRQIPWVWSKELILW